MNIVFVSAVFPYPLYSGGQIRIYNLLKRLSKNHTIHLFAFIRQEGERDLVKHLDFCASVSLVYRGRAWKPSYIARSMLGSYPWLFSTYDNQEMKDVVSRFLRQNQIDLIHIEPGYVYPSLPSKHPPLVTCEHNIEHTIYQGYVDRFWVPLLKPLLSLDVQKMKRWERTVWQKSAAIVAVSDEDKDEIEGLVPGRRVSVVANGVDGIEFPYRPKKTINKVAPTFLFVGNFLWMQNRDAVEFLIKDIWPRIVARFPRACLRIVGKHLPGNLRRILPPSGVKLLENVLTIQGEFVNADMLLAPIRVGGGTKYKILEAMASGVPVVTTTTGAKGIHVRHGKELLVGDGADETVEEVARLTNDSYRLRLVRLARDRVQREYSWVAIAGDLDAAWRNVYETHS